jgi:hypothetical protein
MQETSRSQSWNYSSQIISGIEVAELRIYENDDDEDDDDDDDDDDDNINNRSCTEMNKNEDKNIKRAARTHLYSLDQCMSSFDEASAREIASL